MGVVAARGRLPAGVLGAGDDPRRVVYIRPLSEGNAFDARFARCEVLIRGPRGVVAGCALVDDVLEWAWKEGEDAGVHVAGLIERLRAPRPPFAGVALDRPRVMGIVNITPDSFSDGGETAETDPAVVRGRDMVRAGADVVDVGGESTRPGASPVGVALERARVLPVIETLAAEGVTVSVDTRHTAVMRAAVAAGARIVNDITALTGEPDSVSAVAETGATVVLMHMRGEPRTMQDDPRYDHVLLDVYDYLAERVEACVAAGIARSRIAVDPGIGFGKTAVHNVEILGRFSLFLGLGCALAVGASRKSFIARLSREAPPKERLGGSLAAALAAVAQGAHIVRVHDVAPTRQALDLWSAIGAAARP